MAFQNYANADTKIVRQCIRAIVDELDFHACFGSHRAIAAPILASWPNLDDSVQDSGTTRAFNNPLHELAHGVPRSPEE